MAIQFRVNKSLSINKSIHNQIKKKIQHDVSVLWEAYLLHLLTANDIKRVKIR